MTMEERLTQAASAVGILAAALPDAVARGVNRFTLPPTDSELEAWAVSLKATAPHFFPPLVRQAPEASGVPPGIPESVWHGMSPSTKLTYAREHQPPRPVERRPKPLVLSSEQAAHLATLPPAQRLAAYRQLQQEG